MEMGDQFHGLAAFSPGKEPPVIIKQQVCWHPQPLWTCSTREKFLPLPELNLIPWLSSLKSSYYRLSYSSSILDDLLVQNLIRRCENDVGRNWEMLQSAAGGQVLNS
jgi:hypothetical protein